MAARIQLRRDTAANWASVNPVLAQGEQGHETDTGRLKIGDGATAWNALIYRLSDPSNVAITGGSIGGVAMNGGTLNGVAVGSVTGYVPPSSPWLSDSIHGVDIYGKGYVQRPTIFFDPTAVGSRNLGTYKHPYTTVAQVQARVAGNMAGQVLGLKRGMTLRSPLAFTCYGSSGGPFYVVPYGDAKAMPIISCGTVRTGWSAYGGDARLWQNSGTFASDVDVFEVTGGVYNRLWAVSSIANLQAYIAAPVAGTVGAFTRVANTLYLYLQDGSNANLGQIETADSASVLRINYSDVPGTGNIVVAGIAVRMSRDSALTVFPANNAGANAPSGIQIVGCQASQAGAQYGTNLGADGIIVYGISDTKRANGNYVAGNYSYENLNNAYEVAWSDNGVFERNIGYANGGNSVLEMYVASSNNTIRYNRGYGHPTIRTATRTNAGSFAYHDSGVWIAGFNDVSVVDPTKNVGNQIYCNYIQDFGAWGVDLSGDQNTQVFNNTFAAKNATPGNSHRFGGGVNSTGRNAYNNLSFFNSPGTFVNFVRIYTQAGADLNTPMPTMDYNIYINKTRPDSSGGAYTIGGTGYFNDTTWRAAVGGEAHSKSSMSFNITDGWTWQALQNGDGTAWLASNTDYSLGTSDFKLAGTSIAATAMATDIDGRAILAPATPNIGANQS